MSHAIYFSHCIPSGVILYYMQNKTRDTSSNRSGPSLLRLKIIKSRPIPSLSQEENSEETDKVPQAESSSSKNPIA